MDGRPRRSTSIVDYNQLEREYEERIKAELLQASRRRSTTSEREMRKRKRESESPKQVYRHTAIREGLRNSLPQDHSSSYLLNDGSSPESAANLKRKGIEMQEQMHNDDPHKRADSESSPEIDNIKSPRIVRLHLHKSRSRAPGHQNSLGSPDLLSNGDISHEHGHVRRSSRLDAQDPNDVDEENVVIHRRKNGFRNTKASNGHKIDSDEDSEEQYVPRKSSRRAQPIVSDDSLDDEVRKSRKQASRMSSSSRKSRKTSRKAASQSDEDDYVDDSADDDEQVSEISLMSDEDNLDDFVEDDESRPRTRRSKRSARSNGATKRPRRSTRVNESDEEFSGQSSPLDLQAELNDLRPQEEETRRRELRDRTNRPDYALPPPLTDQMIVAASTPTRNRSLNVRTSFRGLYPEYASLGLGLTANNHKYGNFGPPQGLQSDSDSSDDEGQTSKTTAKAVAGALLPALKSMDQAGVGGGPSNFGKIKGSNLADADPIGIDKDVNFESVGGLEDHINQLKEMVSLPLLYPEIFQRFHISPPRGVLFHGPPGTGKTLMARALAASCSSEGRQISFYMRKGADCLSKWVGEAERQLRLLFDEAKANQPSIIFFDEIDGLAPVRSAKQDQIHASIVSTMLALMDGMDARGQVVVIGATNRPDSVDPALRRPGRFDREFYFPLPSLTARKQIISIQTSKWDPPLDEDFRTQLALQTKGYGGADLRALCTEAALNAVQRRYPQIYASKEKLVIDPKAINVVPRDFMLAIKKIIPSSARSNASGAAALPEHMQPLLEGQLRQITSSINKLVPSTKAKTNLEDNASAPSDDNTFATENMLQMLDRMRTYRPRLLLTGAPGMGQQHLGRAILQHLEGFHVQNLDLSMMFSDSASTAEASLIQAFVEARRHKPSVLYMPEVELWFATANSSTISTLKALLSAIAASDPLLLLGITSAEPGTLTADILDVFGHGYRSVIELLPTTEATRLAFFSFLSSIVSKSPAELPDALPRVIRQPEILPVAPPAPPREMTRAERKAIEAKDRKTKLLLKGKLGPLMDLIKTRYKRFKKPIIDDREIAHLLIVDESLVPEDIGNRDFERTDDGKILKRSTGKVFYNMDINLIEERLWSNLYLTPKQFQADIEQILHDASQEEGDRERTLKAQEMHTNVLIHLEEMFEAGFIEDCKAMAHREVERHKQHLEKMQQIEAQQQAQPSDLGELEPDPTHGKTLELDSKEGSFASPRGTSVHNPTKGHSGSTMLQDDVMLDAPATPACTGDAISPQNAVNGETTEDANGDVDSAPVVQTGQGLSDAELHTATSAPSQALQSIMNPAPELPVKSSELSQTENVSTHMVNGDCDHDMQRAVNTIEHAPYELDPDGLESKLHAWASMTEGLSIDQLEELNSAAIDSIWSLRSVWNRNIVAEAAHSAVLEMVRLFRARL